MSWSSPEFLENYGILHLILFRLSGALCYENFSLIQFFQLIICITFTTSILAGFLCFYWLKEEKMLCDGAPEIRKKMMA